MARNWELVGAVPTLCATGSGMVEISQSIIIAMSAMGPRENGGTRVLEHAVDMQVRRLKNWKERGPNHVWTPGLFLLAETSE